MEQAYKIEELKSKVKAGIPLTDGEFNALSEHRNIQAAMNRPAFDFAEVESVLHGGNIERQAIIDQNKRFADANPHKRGGGYVCTGFGGGLIPLDECKPAQTNGPASIILPPYGGSIRGSIQRMLDKFWARLAEVRETGKLAS